MIRALRPDDLPAVAALYADWVGWDVEQTTPGLVAFFTRTMFEDPHHDPELPSLVFEDARDGVVGVLGSRTRRFALRDRTLRMACSGPLVAHPDHRSRGVGALLLRRYLAGPQEMTAADRALDDVELMWRKLGGVTHTAASAGWSIPVAPSQFVAGRLTQRAAGRELPPGRRLLRALDTPIVRRLAPAPRAGRTELLGPAELIDLVRRLRRRFPIVPAYDEPYLRWLFAELEVARIGGSVVRRLVLDERDRPVGSYVLFAADGGLAHITQVIAGDDDVPLVMEHLLHDAAEAGAVDVRGRFEPHLLGWLRARRCRMLRAGWTVVHAREPELIAAALSGQLLFSRLDGEWWMIPHTRAPAAGAQLSPVPAAPS